MSVRKKLLLLLVLAVGGFALIFGANLTGERITGRMLALQFRAVEAAEQMLQARRQEKNFLLRKEDGYAGQVAKHVDAARDVLESIRTDDPDMAERCATALKLLQDYRASFMAQVDLERAIGLTEKDGLRWQFIQAARALEAGFKGLADDSFLIALLQLRRQEKNFIVRRTDEYLQKALNNLKALRTLAESEAMPQDRQGAALAGLAGYEKAFKAYVDSLTREDSVAVDLVRSARAVEPVVADIRDQFQASRAATGRVVNYTVWSVEILAVAAMILVILGVSKSITRPLAALQRYSRAVASGDLTAEPEGLYQMEFRDLGSDLKGMVLRLKQEIAMAEAKSREAEEQADKAGRAMDKAQEQESLSRDLLKKMHASAVQAEGFAENLASSSEQLSALIDQVKDGATVQSRRMAETATAMEQMNASVLEVARNSTQASTSAQGAKEKATTGADLVRRAVAAIAQVNEQTLSMRQSMEELGRQVDAIGQVMEVIGEIADQTNLLALNAAIEAARAGDAGRGFAVVADEVRKLAEKTMHATKEVESNIQAIQRASKSSIDRMEAAARAVADSTGLATSSGQAQEEILSLVEENSLQMEGIASAAEEQSAASEQINRAIDEVSRIAEETAGGMHSSVEAVRALAGTALELRRMFENMLRADSEVGSAAA